MIDIWYRFDRDIFGKFKSVKAIFSKLKLYIPCSQNVLSSFYVLSLVVHT